MRQAQTLIQSPPLPCPAPPCRFVFVLDGEVEVEALPAGQARVSLHANDYAFLPAGAAHGLASAAGAGLLVFERRYAVEVRT